MRGKRVWQFYAIICKPTSTDILKYWQGNTHAHQRLILVREGSTQLSAPCLQLVWWLYFLQTHTHIHTTSTQLHLTSVDEVNACLYQNHVDCDHCWPLVLYSQFYQSFSTFCKDSHWFLVWILQMSLLISWVLHIKSQLERNNSAVLFFIGPNF